MDNLNRRYSLLFITLFILEGLQAQDSTLKVYGSFGTTYTSMNIYVQDHSRRYFENSIDSLGIVKPKRGSPRQVSPSVGLHIYYPAKKNWQIDYRLLASFCSVDVNRTVNFEGKGMGEFNFHYKQFSIRNSLLAGRQLFADRLVLSIGLIADRQSIPRFEKQVDEKVNVLNFKQVNFGLIGGIEYKPPFAKGKVKIAYLYSFINKGQSIMEIRNESEFHHVALIYSSFNYHDVCLSIKIH